MSIQTTPAEDVPTETVAEQPSISKDDLFHLLQNARRRAVLRYFAAHPGKEEFNMRAVAEAIAAWENETTVEQLSSDQRQRVYIALYQSHLPKLDDYGVIEYNQPRGLIVPTALTALFEPYLDEEFDAVPIDQRIAIPEDRSSLGSAVRSLLNR
ncbi:DUF7344 domain-containing protein [Halalkalicoccus jeotgali]|uniref:DUF7344 domain-containing protein n=1 Tax=Halalkalicoccus jeotgali (strain DSM 18796 / CECT 7217 / JCM 14584 / KCTC 4019 / B3) TaxID=795797 RepID=D8J357_HALJB|nr:hypothetical protein [Halalkalicoccus jeotgali]ADJ15164.1 hypothetical protein HacjB3_08905 [Halalkalicoccus jeotgali B3]ELY35116.1 hypothetical protein C497_13775 [Halalkalicoccus jeotgali B3]